MKDVDIKNEQGEVIKTIQVNETSDYVNMYKEARYKAEQMQQCLEVLTQMIQQHETLKMPVSVNLITIFADLDFCDRDAVSILLKPLAKACRKALNKNETAMNNYYKLVKHIVDNES